MMVVFYKSPFKVNRRVPLTEGPFFVETLWVLKLTYGSFLRYLLANMAVDSFFIYIVINWFKQMGYASQFRLEKNQMFGIVC
jgi:hypothetical protein